MCRWLPLALGTECSHTDLFQGPWNHLASSSCPILCSEQQGLCIVPFYPGLLHCMARCFPHAHTAWFSPRKDLLSHPPLCMFETACIYFSLLFEGWGMENYAAPSRLPLLPASQDLERGQSYSSAEVLYTRAKKFFLARCDG